MSSNMHMQMFALRSTLRASCVTASKSRTLISASARSVYSDVGGKNMFADEVSDVDLLGIFSIDSAMGVENNAHYASCYDSATSVENHAHYVSHSVNPVQVVNGHIENALASALGPVSVDFVEKHHMFRHVSEMCQLKGDYLKAEVTGFSQSATFMLEFSMLPVCDASSERADCHPNLLFLAKKKRQRQHRNVAAAANISSTNYRLFLVYHLGGLYVVDLSDFAGDVNTFLGRLTQSNALDSSCMMFDPATHKWTLELGANGVMLTIIKPLRNKSGDKVTIDDVITRMVKDGRSALDATSLRRALAKISVHEVHLRVRQYAVSAAGFSLVAEGISSSAVRDKKNAATAVIKISHAIGQRDLNGDFTFCAARKSTIFLVLHHKTDPHSIKATMECEGVSDLAPPLIESVLHGVLVELSIPPQRLTQGQWLCSLSLIKNDDTSEPVHFVYRAHSVGASAPCGCSALSLGLREEQSLARASPRRIHGRGPAASAAKRRTAPASPEDRGYDTSSSPANNNADHIPESDGTCSELDKDLADIFAPCDWSNANANLQLSEVDTDGALLPRQHYFPPGLVPLQTSFLASLEHDGPVFEDPLEEVVRQDSLRQILFVLKLVLAFIVLPLLAVWLANK